MLAGPEGWNGDVGLGQADEAVGHAQVQEIRGSGGLMCTDFPDAGELRPDVHIRCEFCVPGRVK